MNRKIKVRLPINLTHEESPLFKRYISYKFPSPKIRHINGAFITSTGLVCGKRGLIKECLHYTWKNEFDVCLKRASRFYLSAKENPENLYIFDNEETYLVIHHPWFGNYYHWITEALFRLWMVKDETYRMILILPPQEELNRIAMDSLKLFNFKNIIHIPIDKSALVRTLCMPELKPEMASFNPCALLELNSLYVNYVNKQLVNTNLGERIFVSRKNAVRRKIINEDEVIKIMIKHNFNIIYSEEYTFFEQVAIFSNAKCLAGLHGAGFTNMIFMPPGSTIFEFHKSKTNSTHHHNLIFWYMASALGHNYYHQICEPTDFDEDFYTANIIVDTDLLTENLRLIIDKL